MLRYSPRDPAERIIERGAQISKNRIVGVSGVWQSAGLGALASPITESGTRDDGTIYTVHEFLTEVDFTEDEGALTVVE
jgi:hypothetical protein